MGTRPLALVTLALLACSAVPPAPAPYDGGDPASCDDACAHLAELGCEEAEPTAEGATCVEVCRNVEGSSIVSLNPSCVVLVESCEAVGDCVD